MVDEASWDKAMGQPWAGKLLDGVIAAFETAPWDAAALEAAWREVVGGASAPSRKLTQGPVRVAVTGRISRAAAVPEPSSSSAGTRRCAGCGSPASGCRA